MIYRLPIDPEFQALFRTVVDVMPVGAFQDGEATGEQALDRATGYPMWELAVILKMADDRKAETIYVRVPAPRMPELIGQRPVFGGLEADKPAYPDNRGGVNSSWKFTAATVSTATAPSLRRSTEVISPENGKVPAPAA